MQTERMSDRLRAYLESIGLQRNASDLQAWAFVGKLTGEQQQRANAIRGHGYDPLDTMRLTTRWIR